MVIDTCVILHSQWHKDCPNAYIREREFLVMGIFDLISKSVSKARMQTQKMGHMLLAQAIIAEFYSDYPEAPYISVDRPADWVEHARMMPKQCLVDRKMMQRFPDGLLPGHVYILYWLKKYTGKKVPAYFEYKYGIDFEKEKMFLQNTGLLDETDKPTAAGERVIENHIEVVKGHTPPKPDTTTKGITKRILASRDNMLKNGSEEYVYMVCHDCCDVCAALKGKHFPLSKLQPGKNAPPMHDGCRCSIAPYVDEAEYEAWLDFISNGGTTAEWERMKGKRKKK